MNRRLLAGAVTVALAAGAGVVYALSGQHRSIPAVESVPSLPLPFPSEVAALVQPSVVLVSVKTATGSRTASGFVFNEGGDVLTDADALSGWTAVSVTDNERNRLVASVLGLDAAAGIAELRVPGLKAGPLEFATSAPGVGDTVLVVADRTVRAQVSALDATEDIAGFPHRQMIQLDVAAGRAFGGAPVVNRSARLVGILHPAARAPGIAFAIPPQAFLPEAQRWARSGSARLPDEGAAIRLVASYYDAINQRNYRAAYTYLGPDLQRRQPYDQFAAGFADTVRDEILRLESGPPAADGSVEVKIGFIAHRTRDSSMYTGTYLVGVAGSGRTAILKGELMELWFRSSP